MLIDDTVHDCAPMKQAYWIRESFEFVSGRIVAGRKE